MDSLQLQSLLHSLLGDVFCGVWASDQLPLLTPSSESLPTLSSTPRPHAGGTLVIAGGDWPPLKAAPLCLAELSAAGRYQSCWPSHFTPHHKLNVQTSQFDHTFFSPPGSFDARRLKLKEVLHWRDYCTDWLFYPFAFWKDCNNLRHTCRPSEHLEPLSTACLNQGAKHIKDPWKLMIKSWTITQIMTSKHVLHPPFTTSHHNVRVRGQQMSTSLCCTLTQLQNVALTSAASPAASVVKASSKLEQYSCHMMSSLLGIHHVLFLCVGHKFVKFGPTFVFGHF